MRPVYFLEEDRLNIELLNEAKSRVPSIPVLINMLSKRVRQLNSGMGPLVKPERGDEKVDVALREIIDGKLIAEIDFSAAPAESESVL